MKPESKVIWRGASKLTGEPILVRGVEVTGAIEALAEREIVCPASAERDLITCNACGLCAGASKRGRNVAIINHSTQALATRRKLGDLRVIQ